MPLPQDVSSTSGSSTVIPSEGLILDSADDLQRGEQAKINQQKFSTLAIDVKKTLGNDDQAQVIDAMQKISAHHIGVAGPAGTGKTALVTRLTWLLVSVRHKLVVCAPSDIAVDYVATATLKNRLPDCQDKKLLRLELQSIEKDAVLQEAINNPNIDAKKLPVETAAPISLDEDYPFLATFHYLIGEYFRYAEDEARHEDLESSMNTLGEFKAHSREVERVAASTRATSVPYEMTLPYHIGRLCKEDMLKAKEEYEHQKQSTDEGQWGELVSVETRSPSYPYTKWYDYFINQEGQLNADEAKTFIKSRAQIEERVLNEIDILFIKLNEAGLEVAHLGFNPSVLIVEDAARASASTMLIPMTAFEHCKALVMFGDPQQSKPNILARQFSEVHSRSLISPFHMICNSGRNLYVLREQYRMAQAIHHFPNQQFYNRRLNCNAAALEENFLRRCVRKVCLEHYGIKGESPLRDGSEYFLIDVVRGAARIEPGDTSLLNRANVDAVSLANDRLLAAGVPAKNIVILSMCKAQFRQLAMRIEVSEDGQEKYHSISTIEDFHSLESCVVILDLVIAKDFEKYAPSAMFREEAVDPKDPEPSVVERRYDGVPSVARDHHDLCSALTRASDGMIIVGQLARLISSLRSKRDPLYNTLFWLAKDARKRNLVATDLTHLDTYPEATRERAERARHNADGRVSEAARMTFIKAYEDWGREAARKQPPTASDSLFGSKVDLD
ncbi:MAG: hypothetical protein Q9170_004055 [Blastenia crenularia]